MVVGYAGVAEVFLRLWQMQSEVPGIGNTANADVRSRARQSCAALRSFSRVFRVGLPYKYLWTGLYHWQSAHHEKALASWSLGLKAAEQLKMPYEVGLLHFEIASHLEQGSSQRDHHIQEADEIFSRLGALSDLERLHALVN
jgi:hypothetical protein